ncbi:MAG TPA: acyl carrier protein, partial [Pyrinomonadaceae bacterium]
RELLLAAEPQERRDLLGAYVNELGAKVLGIAPSTFEPHKPLNTLGLDSLMAIELKNSLQANVGVVVPMVRIMQGPSASELVEFVLELLSEQIASGASSSGHDGEAYEGRVEPAAAFDDVSSEDAAQLLAGLDELSQEQIDQLLSNLLVEEKVEE